MIGILCKNITENRRVRKALDTIGVKWKDGQKLTEWDPKGENWHYALYYGHCGNNRIVCDEFIDYKTAKADMENTNHKDPRDDCSQWFYAKDVIANPNIVIEAYERETEES